MTNAPHYSSPPAVSADHDAGLARLNALATNDATRVFSNCCGSRRWVDRMLAARPYATRDDLLAAADREWTRLDREDWLEAFGHHPRIGERNLAQPRLAATAVQSGKEQSGMAGATEEQRAEFGINNAEYERRFGHVFLICATGKSATEMLDQLRTRIKNDAATELTNAAREQSRITALRLERWLNS